MPKKSPSWLVFAMLIAAAGLNNTPMAIVAVIMWIVDENG